LLQKSVYMLYFTTITCFLTEQLIPNSNLLHLTRDCLTTRDVFLLFSPKYFFLGFLTILGHDMIPVTQTIERNENINIWTYRVPEHMDLHSGNRISASVTYYLMENEITLQIIDDSFCFIKDGVNSNQKV
jgi:hypothetical protein